MRKLSASVNISELLAMREQGLTNYQIAERLGVTYRTIVSYIGKQPKGLRAPKGSRKGTKPLADIEPEEVAESPVDVSSLIEGPAEDAFVHELLAVFGRKTVRNYLKVALYVSGNVFITTPTHVGMLSALRKMNAEVNVGD